MTTFNTKLKSFLSGIVFLLCLAKVAHGQTVIYNTTASGTHGAENSFFGYLAGPATYTSGGDNNAYFGYAAGAYTTSGANNVFIGAVTGSFNTIGSDNVFSGYAAGNYNTTGSYNVFIGYYAGLSNTTGFSNSFFGAASGNTNSTGFQNVFIGDSAGYSNTTGNGNIFTGVQAGYSNTTGKHNIFCGSGAGYLSSVGSGNIFTGFTSGFSNTTGSYNSYYGNAAGFSNTGGSKNAFFGDSAGFHNTTSQNAFFGYGAGVANTIGNQNVFSGYQAGYSNTTAYDNVFNGYRAGYSNTTGLYNVFSGGQTGYYNTMGSNNTFNGYEAGFVNTTGSGNAFSGSQAGYQNTTGSDNVFSGAATGNSNTTGSNNTFSGYEAGFFNTNGIGNTFEGFFAGYANATGSHNTIIGDSANVGSASLTNATAIGYNAKVSQSNSIVLGNGANVGIGTSAPNAKAVLDLTSTTQGLLIPRMNTTQRNAISGPATGLQVYDNTLNQLYVYNGTAWVASGTGAYTGGAGISIIGSQVNSVWSTTGNNIYNNNSLGNVGIGTSSPAYTLQVNGTAAKPGSATWTIASDARLKTNITPYNEGLNVLNQINPVWFQYSGEAGMPAGQKFVGVIAQDMQKIAPYMVGSFNYKDDKGNKTDYLDYDANSLLYILVNSVKAQQQQIVSKDSVISTQQQQISGLQQQMTEVLNRMAQLEQCTNCNPAINPTTSNTITNLPATLDQNIPNPFSQSTVIGYYVPQIKNSASIMVSTLQGNQIQSFVITATGKGQITISSGVLTAGEYIYTLVVDGVKVDSKKMIIVRD